MPKIRIARGRTKAQHRLRKCREFTIASTKGGVPYESQQINSLSRSPSASRSAERSSKGSTPRPRRRPTSSSISARSRTRRDSRPSLPCPARRHSLLSAASISCVPTISRPLKELRPSASSSSRSTAWPRPKPGRQARRRLMPFERKRRGRVSSWSEARKILPLNGNGVERNECFVPKTARPIGFDDRTLLLALAR